MIASFQLQYPQIEFELLLGDYMEIEQWIANGRVDFGFVRLSTLSELEIHFVQQDELLVILPTDHYLNQYNRISLNELGQFPFILLAKDKNSDVLELFDTLHFTPNIQFTTWDDYAVMSLIENGLGISILPELILNRVTFDITKRPLETPVFRNIGVAYKNKETLSLAATEFLTYLEVR